LKKAHNAVPGNPGANLQSGPLQVICHGSGGLLLRIGRLRDLMKLSTYPDDLLLMPLNRFFHIDHVLTSKKEWLGTHRKT
jgi:hypothetical protein